MTRLVRREHLMLVAGALVAACGSSDSGGGAAPSGAVLVVSSPTTDPKCPAGATKLDFGLDKNENGQLDPNEITASQIVCDPSGVPTLTTVTPVGPDGTCKNGGIVVKSGPDTNANGKLDDGEVTQTDEICGGGTSTQLTKTTTLPAGDATCPFGGTTTSSGLDNGANGSVAGDGVLQDGEITATSTTCTNGSQYPGTFVPPGGAAGTNKILLSGGAGSAGSGGPGAPFTAQLAQGTLGGNVAIFKTGEVDASFTPTVVTPHYGAVPYEVTADTTLVVHTSSTQAADGEHYIIGNGLYYRQDAANQQITVTGVHVAKNVTLTLPASSTVLLTLTGDFYLEGTLTSGLTTGNRALAALLNIGRFVGAPGSKVALAGAPVAGAAGGNGGTFAVTAHAIYSATAIDTSGAAGDPTGSFGGGNAGVVNLVADVGPGAGPCESVGDIKASGGSGKGNGGQGAPINIQTSTEGVRLKGALDTSGGKGGLAGGSGGPMSVIVQSRGEVRLSGSVTTKGGDVDEAVCSGTCAGGSAAPVQIQLPGGDLRWDASVVASGGKSKGTTGGGGGPMNLVLFSGSDPLTGNPIDAGQIELSGNIDLRGGDGANGGPAQGMNLTVSSGLPPKGQQILLFGYDTVDTSGGTGTTGGGPAAPIQLLNNLSPGGEPTGSVITYANLVAKGGAATASGAGSVGGPVTLTAGAPGTLKAGSSAAVLCAGAVDVSGGAGVSGAGVAGPVNVQSRERVDFFGAITANGGSATGASASGAPAGPITLRGGTGVALHAAITSKGGNGAGATSAGAPSGPLQITGAAVTASAALTCAGGNGNGAPGGNGGPINIASSNAASALAGVSAPFGTGTPNGTAGTITIDGVVQ